MQENKPQTIGEVNRAEDRAAKRRGPAMKWKRFWSIPKKECFYVGRYVAMKLGWFRYGYAAGNKPAWDTSVEHLIWPWTKVRSLEAVKKSDSTRVVPVEVTSGFISARLTRGNTQETTGGNEQCPSA